MREVPAQSTNSTTAYLINEPASYSVLQAEGTSVFAAHRLKSLWSLNTPNMRMSASNLVNGIYTDGNYSYCEGAAIQTLSGPLNSWPNASNSPSGGTNFWTTGIGTAWRAWQLQTTLTTNATGSQPPVFTQTDFPKKLAVTYAVPMPIMSFGTSGTTTNETVSLQIPPELAPGAILQQRTLQTSGTAIQTTFYWPKRPDGIMIYTAPLLQFIQTQITGLTTEPILLTNAFAQTYAPGHHNFTEEFIFEPRLDPGISPTILAELNVANIQLLYAYWNGTTTTIYALGFDRKFRAL